MALYPGRDDIVNEILPLGDCLPGVLPVAFPQIQQQAEGREPRFVHGKVKLGEPVIQQSGKQLLVAYLGGSFYPTAAFFGSVSLST